jgi:hypothetical protein
LQEAIVFAPYQRELSDGAHAVAAAEPHNAALD